MRLILATCSAISTGIAEALYWTGDRFKDGAEWCEARIHSIDVRKLRGRG